MRKLAAPIVSIHQLLPPKLSCGVMMSSSTVGVVEDPCATSMKVCPIAMVATCSVMTTSPIRSEVSGDLLKRLIAQETKLNTPVAGH